ncbi:MAG: diaminopimelate decarboxylase [Clostridia bacterium]|nr:diaminopimelate decarboxylase [Clostridia bacterium]
MNERSTLCIKKGELVIGGCKATELAKEFGTPLYVFDEDYIRKMMSLYKGAIERHYSGNGLPLYASKAFSCLAMYKMADSEGLGVDVVSGGELYTAHMAGFPMEKVYMHGNSKTDEELKMAVDYGVGTMVLDCLEEALILDRLAREKGIKQNVLIRVNPGVEAHTHKYVQTSRPDSKFGFPVADGSALRFVREILKFENLNLLGFHCHIGSQIFEKQSFVLAAQKMMSFVAVVQEMTDYEASVIDIGGGFGIYYTDEDPRLTEEDYESYVEAIAETLKSEAKRLEIKEPYLLLEPGRSIVGEAGVTLYTVNTVKDIPRLKRYVAVDGGMGDNPRYALYQSKYTVLCANRADAATEQIVSIAGKCCESGDIVAADVALPEVGRGDILAVLSTGAYNYSMASNYNRNTIPGAVLVKDGRAETIIKRQSLDDLVCLDVVPESFEKSWVTL